MHIKQQQCYTSNDQSERIYTKQPISISIHTYQPLRTDLDIHQPTKEAPLTANQNAADSNQNNYNHNDKLIITRDSKISEKFSILIQEDYQSSIFPLISGERERRSQRDALISSQHMWSYARWIHLRSSTCSPLCSEHTLYTTLNQCIGALMDQWIDVVLVLRV